jgi:hypothetical protein
MAAASDRQSAVAGQPAITSKKAISVKRIATLTAFSAAMRRERPFVVLPFHGDRGKRVTLPQAVELVPITSAHAAIIPRYGAPNPRI